MADIDSAFRTGFVAGFGLAACKKADGAFPFSDMHTPWTNYVPAWVDAADVECAASTHRPLPYQTAFKMGFDAGMKEASEGHE